MHTVMLVRAVSLVAVVFVSAAGIATPSAARPRESPLACDREALSSAERKRHFEDLGPALRKARKSVRELPDGFEFEFPGDRATYAMLSEWVAGERVCCPFFDITLQSDREGGPLRLRLKGREGVKQFMEVEGREWIASRPGTGK